MNIASDPARRSASYMLAAIAIAAIVLGVSNLGTPTSSARTSKEVVEAAQGVVQNTVSGTGNVEPGVEDDVNFSTNGTLTSIDVKVGQHVTKGELLATLDPSSAELTLSAARATLTAAQDEATSATGDASASDEVQVESDEATVNADEKAVAETKLYAPVSGTIAAMAGDSVGEAISNGADASAGSDDDSSTASSTTAGSDTSTASSTAFAEIINSKTMTMTVSLSESDISEVKVGQSATISFSALSGVELAARVTSISPLGTEDDDVVSYDATLTIYQQNSKVLPGMSATAAIITSQAQGVTVPTDAVTDASGTSGTVNVEENGKVVSKQVVVGLKGSERDQIVSGLNAGQRVVVTIALPSLSSSSSSTSSTSATTLGGSAGFTGGAPTAGGFAGRAAGAP
jgi:multidrug efflux pump subunit AcrA (membrane-fusion protein)